VRPPLTTVEQPIRKMGERSVELLLSLIRGDKAEPTHITLATNLVIRHSTRAPVRGHARPQRQRRAEHARVPHPRHRRHPGLSAACG